MTITADDQPCTTCSARAGSCSVRLWLSGRGLLHELHRAALARNHGSSVMTDLDHADPHPANDVDRLLGQTVWHRAGRRTAWPTHRGRARRQRTVYLAYLRLQRRRRRNNRSTPNNRLVRP